MLALKMNLPTSFSPGQPAEKADGGPLKKYFNQRYVTWAIFAITISYAFVAGLQKVVDFDMGWQLAAGRYVVQNWSIPSTDVFTYTVNGKPWIYPPFSGVLLYAGWKLGGYGALSILNSLACAATALICLRRRSLFTALLVIAAVPLLASRTQPRAELFTTVLFAVLFRSVWDYFRSGRTWLWMWPLILGLWANLHLGFVAGLGILLAYVVAEGSNLPFATRRADALNRLKRASPWIVFAGLATLINRWGPFLYLAIARQDAVSAVHTQLVGEWHRQPITLSFIAQALRWRDPASGYWWLLLVAVLCSVYAIVRRNVAAPMFLIGAAYLSLSHLRFQALFAIVVIIVAGEMLSIREWAPTSKTLFVASALLVVATVVGAIRISDVVTDRVHLANGELVTFGMGPSWALPESAATFVVRNHLPAQIFNTYDLGGFLMWKIGPEYQVYLDGRAVPFGNEFLARQGELLRSGPDSQQWKQEAERWGLETMFLPTSRYGGLETYPFPSYCSSRDWTPVYLDDVALILVRNDSGNQELIGRLKIDCTTVELVPPPELANDPAALYNFYANSGAIYYLLERDDQAFESYRKAEAIFGADPDLHMSIAQLYEARGEFDSAEAEYRKSVQLHPNEMGWYGLARLLSRERRFSESAAAMRKSAELSYDPASKYKALQQLEDEIHRSQ